MSWKDFVNQKKDFNAEDLRELLCTLVESSDKDSLEEVCTEYKSVIIENFPTWKMVPQNLQADSDMVSRYAAGLIAVANLFDAQGDVQLIEILEDKNNSNNPISQWENDFAEASKCKQIGEYQEAVRILEQLVTDMKNCKGSAVVNYLPMIYGALGENHFLLENYDLAYDITHLALEKTQESSDIEGVVSYTGNLSEICKKLNKTNEAINWVIIATNLMIQTGKIQEAIQIRNHYNIEPAAELITLDNVVE